MPENGLVFLTGFMGSGKSTIGERLAKELGWNFIDLDRMIVRRLGMSIAAYFKEAGESAFRLVESEELQRCQGLMDTVVAVGGGALCSQDNLGWALDHGTVVYLELSPAQLYKRLKNGKTHRPMLHGENGLPLEEEEVLVRIHALLDKRAPYYEAAHLVVSADQSVPRVVQQTLAALRQEPPGRN